MNIAKETEKLKQSLVNAINSSGLPITIKKYVASDIYAELNMAYCNQVAANDNEGSEEVNE